jgi:hypothetical protein
MSLAEQTAAADVRISASELKSRLESGEPITMVDLRNDHAWESGLIKIRCAVRVRPAEWRIDPSWPKDRLTALY